MKKRIIALALALSLSFCTAANAVVHRQEIDWNEEARARLNVGNPTAMLGRFFTTMWGGTTSDLDAQELLLAYSPVRYDMELSHYRFDESVLEDAVSLNDNDGNRTYILCFYDDLLWSDSQKITAADYAFSILFTMDPAIAETGGTPMDYSWIQGADEYLNHTADTVSGLRVISDLMLQITVRADALPYFYELSRLNIYPYPASVLAPGVSVVDDGNGAKLSAPLTAELIRQTVLDPGTGYLSHPSVVSGPYTLTSFDGKMAVFKSNPYFKGTEEGYIPHIGEIDYTRAENATMISKLRSGEFDLLNKVTMDETIASGVSYELHNENYNVDNYVRSGLTLIWFMESSPLVQETAVRQAIAYCFDRDGFTRDYTGNFGMRADAFCGLGQWMYNLATGHIGAPVDPELPEDEQEALKAQYAEANLDGLTIYEPDLEKAGQLLDEAGWIISRDGIRRREKDGEEQELSLILGLPRSGEAAQAFQDHLVNNLEAIGVKVTLLQMSMDQIQQRYEGESEQVDMLYLGENFPIIFDPEILRPQGTADENADTGSSLTAAKEEVYGLALDMVRTEPEDFLGFMRKWIALQERITETLPLLPVYTNTYFDFYSRKLHNYVVTDAVSWADAIVRSFMSDIEVLEGEKRQEILENLENLENLEKAGGEEPEDSGEDTGDPEAFP